ncbi:hypothetical protein TNCV_770991 [Trichonephila clavipes]|nr:hypothetical protein TNCV_770991 [Trichonephila clavipes]
MYDESSPTLQVSGGVKSTRTTKPAYHIRTSTSIPANLRTTSSSTNRVRCGRALLSIKMKSGPMTPLNRPHGEEVPPHNSDPRLLTLCQKCGAQFARSA